MLKREELNIILNNFTKDLKKLFGENLKSVILYGSYARGDYNKESDIDVMILVDIKQEDIYKYRTHVTSIADKSDWNYDTLLSPIIKNINEFETYKNHTPFYKTVNKEGVRLIA